MSLLERVLRWAAAVPSRPQPKPETDWVVVACDARCRYAHTVLPGCAYAQSPRCEDGDESLEDWDALWGYRKGQATGAERLVLDRIAVLSESGTAWDAAVRVFGGAGVAREASRDGLSATLAGEPAESVHG